MMIKKNEGNNVNLFLESLNGFHSVKIYLVMKLKIFIR